MDNCTAGRLPRPNFNFAPEPTTKVRKVDHPFDLLEPGIVKHLKDRSRHTTYLIASQTFFYLGKAYPLEEGGIGKFHKVFTFRDTIKVKFFDETLLTSDIVIKIYNNPDSNVEKYKKLAETIQNDLKAYEYLKGMEIRVPHCYANPETLSSEKDHIWIFERMHTPITGESWAHGETYEELSPIDQRIINFAKTLLTLNAEALPEKTEPEKTDEEFGDFEEEDYFVEVFGDFNPKNVMLDSQNNPAIVDPTLPEKNEWNCREKLIKDVKLWSSDNPNIVEYLTRDFPKDVKKLF